MTSLAIPFPPPSDRWIERQFASDFRALLIPKEWYR